jgi:hypothetical protein
MDPEDKWVQFTQTGNEDVPENIVCATVTIRGANAGDGGLHVTVLTRENGNQRVWQSDCETQPNIPMNPFNPNTRCAEFVQLTPLPD